MSKKSELVQLLMAAIERDEDTAYTLTNDLPLASRSNPQVLAVINSANTRAECFQAVLDAINGNSVSLKLFAGE